MYLQNRPLCVMVLSFCGGIFIVHQYPSVWIKCIVIAVIIIIIMFVVCTMLLLKIIFNKAKCANEKKILRSNVIRPVTVLFCMVLFIIGCIITHNKYILFNERLPKDKDKILLTGIVSDYEIKENSIAVYLDSCVCKNFNSSFYADNIRCLAYVSKSENLQIGNEVSISGKVNRWKNPTNKGQFNEKDYYLGQGVYFSIFADEFKIINNDYKKITQQTKNIKGMLADNFDKICSEKNSGIFKAMILGDKKGIAEDVKKLFMEGSIGHTLVISGLHFSVAGLFVFKVAGQIFSVIPAGIISMLVLLLFGVMTGFSTSAKRAFVMFLITILSKIWGRDYDLPTSLAVAVFVILIGNPYTMFLPGFVLSVCAILGIIIVVPALGNNLNQKIKLPDTMSSSLGIQIFTLPVSLYYYFNFNPYSLVLNGIVLPAMPVVLIDGIISVLMCFLSQTVAKILIIPAHIILNLICLLCKVMSKLPFYLIYPGKPGFKMCVIYYAVLIGGMYFFYKKNSESNNEKHQKENIQEGRSKGETGYNKYACLLCLMLPILLFIHKKSMLDITMLDVGQGQSIFIQTKDNMRLLYDGGSTDISEVGKFRIIPFLKASGCTKLDAVFISHFDADHISGIEEIIESGDIEISVLFVPDTNLLDEPYQRLTKLAGQHNISVKTFGKGSSLKYGNLRLTGYYPESSFNVTDRNNTSIVMRVEYKINNADNNFSMLLCGDMEEAAENEILSENTLSHTDVLQVAHHGSEYTTHEEFLDKVNPSAGLISCGTDNKYGHPHNNLLERLEKYNIDTYVTKDCGAIEVVLTKENYNVIKFGGN